MKFHPLLLVSLLTCLVLPAAHGQSQLELNTQACGEYQKADGQLNSVYQQIRRQYSGQKQFLDKLTRAERAWIAYRDAHLDSRFPSNNPQLEYGSVYPMCRCQELTQLTRERIQFLKRWVEGVPEGEVCSGSIRISAVNRPLASRCGSSATHSDQTKG
ncbi:lysozyme inhibitor LprI family protein [Gloeobacter kilaueensis]|uniref:Lysozyme inhibitor LprI-like N-terminal domain-containing protein n=1 Tax=Gloeobacter kilaueensis (strain ATCC BAA-2537 / CCAP 1431/1 / ULC 316 / JS1) TaxID=1183438 RepID=U5QLH1_GLOK1|nr:lysozyme inhibitor LprI family protein [Gloeobacter kilaueensis]AGY58525.1 hypothetical protein GKIL_2279 [Gloeobacter kilaueensis JS1]